MTTEPVLSIGGTPHYGPFLGRKSHDPNTGRVLLEVIDDDDSVLIRDGDEFVTFFAGAPLARTTPTGPIEEEPQG